VTQNIKEAASWWCNAAEQGLAQAQHNLGICYINGLGVVKNEIEAYKWHLLAASQGNDSAKKDTDEIERLLQAEERAEGQRLAQEWDAAHI
jgi:hypothetical protein